MSQTEFYRGVAAAAAALAQHAAAPADVRAAAVHAAFAALDVDADGLRACRRGCDHCCHLPVGITFGEALRLAAALSPAQAARVVAAAEQVATASWRDLVGQPCPLLHERACIAHPARPLPCRALASSDAELCARALREPVAVPFDRSAFWRGIGAGDALAAAEAVGGHRELRSALAAVLQAAGPERAAAFTAARGVGDETPSA